MQPAKLLMTWDLRPGQDQAYLEFNAKEFVPRLMKLGLQPMDSWYTLYGKAPRFTAGWVGEDAASIRRLVSSPEWAELERELDRYVLNFQYRIVPVTGPFQM
jgi:hypothetical protein